MSTWADTRWGLACAAIAALVAVDFPTIVAHYGPDGAALNKAAPCIVFEELREPIGPALRGGQTWDRLVQVRVTIWMSNPVDAEAALESFLLALNTSRHGRAAKPEAFVPSGGATGEAGAKYVGTVQLRLTVAPRDPVAVAPESVDVEAKVSAPGTATESAGLA